MHLPSFSIFLVLTITLLQIGVITCDNFAWVSANANNHGTRNANDFSFKPSLSSANVASIGVTHAFATDGGFTTATAYVDSSVVIFPSSDGYLYCLHQDTFLLKWKTFIPDISDIEGDRSRTTPVRWHNYIIFGHRSGGRASAVNYYTGEQVWTSVVHDHPAATVTASFTLRGDTLFFGISSLEESFAADEEYPCCSFVGAFVALNARDGELLRSFPLIDPSVTPIGPGGYSGVGAWGSQPLIYERDNAVIFATGNPYDVPLSVQSCQDSNPESFDCIHPLVYFNGVLSLDIDTFELKWYRRLSAYDAWVVACIFGGPNCPDVAGPDADFGMNGVLVEGVETLDGKHDIIMIGQKSGVAWNLNARTGDIICSVSLGPGGTLGGMSWAAATDGDYFYASNVNNGNICHYINWPVYTQTYAGAWSKVSLSTCSISWTIANPSAMSVGEDSPDYNSYHFGSLSVGPPSLVNDLVVVTDTSIRGSVVFIEKSSGNILKVVDTGSTIYGGVSIFDNCIYVGNGYDPIFSPYFTEGNTFFKMCVPHPIA